MNRSCFHANRGYLIGVTVLVLCLLAVLHPGTKARLTFSKEVRPGLASQSTPEGFTPITPPAYSAQGQREHTRLKKPVQASTAGSVRVCTLLMCISRLGSTADTASPCG